MPTMRRSSEGAVSLTPIHLDTTHHGVLEQFRSWERSVASARQVAATCSSRQAEEAESATGS